MMLHTTYKKFVVPELIFSCKIHKILHTLCNKVCKSKEKKFSGTNQGFGEPVIGELKRRIENNLGTSWLQNLRFFGIKKQQNNAKKINVMLLNHEFFSSNIIFPGFTMIREQNVLVSQVMIQFMLLVDLETFYI